MGLATAQLLASRGATVALADLNEKGLKAALPTLAPPAQGKDKNHMCTVVDVTSSDSVNQWIDTIIDYYGRLDGAVNMAGIITPATPIAEMSDKSFEFTMNVNSKGVFFCLRAQIKAIMKTAGKGSIVSATSLLWKAIRAACKLARTSLSRLHTCSIDCNWIGC